MKSLFIGLSVMASVAPMVMGCGVADKVSEAQAQVSALEEEFQSFDLTCDFSEVSGSSTKEAAADLPSAGLAEDTSSACSNVSEQYALLLKEFDADGDGKLSTDELAEAEAGWSDAQVGAMDGDADGKVSQTEKSKWRQEKLPARKEKLGERFQEACRMIGKEETDCKKLHDDRKAEFKEDFKKRVEDFDADKDGKLSEGEKAAAETLLSKERKDRFKEKIKGEDKNGDGKLGDSERAQRRTERRDNRPPLPPKP